MLLTLLREEIRVDLFESRKARCSFSVELYFVSGQGEAILRGAGLLLVK